MKTIVVINTTPKPGHVNLSMFNQKHVTLDPVKHSVRAGNLVDKRTEKVLGSINRIYSE